MNYGVSYSVLEPCFRVSYLDGFPFVIALVTPRRIRSGTRYFLQLHFVKQTSADEERRKKRRKKIKNKKFGLRKFPVTGHDANSILELINAFVTEAGAQRHLLNTLEQTYQCNLYAFLRPHRHHPHPHPQPHLHPHLLHALFIFYTSSISGGFSFVLVSVAGNQLSILLIFRLHTGPISVA